MSLLALTTLVAAAVAAVATAVAFSLWRESRLRAEARRRALAAAIEGVADPGVSSTPTDPAVIAAPPGSEWEYPSLFTSAGTGWHDARRLVPAIGVGALVVVSMTIALLAFGGHRSATATAAPTPVELLSMRHVVEGQRFVVRGMVRNPDTTQARERVSVAVFLFDDTGGFITSAKAPLEFLKLGPGEESPFEVTVPRPARLDRYRLSFRAADGSVMPHVDLREER